MSARKAKLRTSRVTVVEAVQVEHAEGCACEKGPSPFEAFEESPFAAWERQGGAAETPSACTPVIRNGKVERTCMPGGVRISGPKDVWKVVKEQTDRSGVEQFLVVGSSIQEEMIGDRPTLVAMGQVSGVRVDVSSVLVAMLALRASGAVTLFCAHNHPSSTNHEASSQDRELTRRIKKGFDAALPEATWGGHIICSSKGFTVDK